MGSGISAKIQRNIKTGPSSEEFNVSKIKCIDSYVGKRKFSLELQKKKHCVVHASRIDLDMPIMHAVSTSEMEM